MPGAPNSNRNKALLLLILFLDLLGFTLIFPLIPDLLEHYLRQAVGLPIDLWLIALGQFIETTLPRTFETGEAAKDAGGYAVGSLLIVVLGGILASLYSLLQFLTAPYWGRLSDRLGRRRVLLITSVGLTVSYLVWFLSQSFTLFIVSRVIGGVMSGNMGVASAAMADITSPEDRTRAMGMVGAAFGMGFILGPAIGGLAAIFGEDLRAVAPGILHIFSAPALAAFVLSLLSAVLNFVYFSETLSERAGGGHVWIENPITLFLRSLREPAFGPILLVNFLYVIVFAAYEFSFTFLFKLEFGLTPPEIGLIFLYMGVVLVLGQGGLVRVLSKRMHAKPMLLIGLALMPIPMYLLARVAPSVPLALAVLLPVSIGAALIQPAIAGLASLAVAADKQGVSLGLLRSAGSLGRTIGPLAGAYAYWTFGSDMTYLLIGALLLVTLLFALRLRSIEPG
ncbi:MAG: MFS transporter [bacterium]|nr:MFS transporter [bacterium]